ncbi:MAG: hypothetical protein ACON4U_05105 [Myxococcota bacterium]
MSNWKRLGNVTKGILREALSSTQDQELSEEELLARLDQIRSKRTPIPQSTSKPAGVAHRDETGADKTVETDEASEKDPHPPTRKPL